jgi:hypothetical protein
LVDSDYLINKEEDGDACLSSFGGVFCIAVALV